MRLQIAIIAAMLGAPLMAQDVLRIEGTVLNEEEPDQTLISKPGWLRGLHVIGRDLPDEARPQIEAVLPDTWLGTTICARITTISGDYTAMVEFDVPEAVDTRLARLEFATKYHDVVTRITPDNSGIALEKGACVGDTAETDRQFIANFWNDASELILNADGMAELLLNMNVARASELIADATLLRGPGAAPAPLAVSCARITTPQALAFNHRCSVLVAPADLAATSEARIAFGYARLYRGRMSDRREAMIFVGAGE